MIKVKTNFMENDQLTIDNNDWLHRDIASVIERLKRDQYAAVKSMGEEEFITLQVRLSKDRQALLAFLPFLDQAINYYISEIKVIGKNEQFERFVAVAPMLRRDAMTIVAGTGKT
ncbi:MAG: hypothetical protein ACYC9J_06850 [Sulfuricaulis sp.]